MTSSSVFGKLMLMVGDYCCDSMGNWSKKDVKGCKVVTAGVVDSMHKVSPESQSINVSMRVSHFCRCGFAFVLPLGCSFLFAFPRKIPEGGATKKKSCQGIPPKALDPMGVSCLPRGGLL